MGKIRLVQADEATYVSTADMLKTYEDGSGATALAEVPAEQLATQMIRSYFTGGPDRIALCEVKSPPGMIARAHAHEHDEVMYVLEGELVVGARSFGPESAIFIEAKTLYDFKVGPEGVRYLNIKPCADASYVTKEELRARRESRSEQQRSEEEAS